MDEALPGNLGGDSRKRSVLLFLDKGPGHVSDKVLIFAVDHNILIIFLPAHTTHLWMVIDTHFDKPFNVTYDNLISKRLSELRPIREEVYFHISRIAYYDAYGSSAKKAFEQLGLFPSNLEKLKEQIEKKYNHLPPTQRKKNDIMVFALRKQTNCTENCSELLKMILTEVSD